MIFAARKPQTAPDTTPVPATPSAAPPIPAMRLWLDGVLTNMANPKTILFYASLFAAVMTPTQSPGHLLLMTGCLLMTSLATNTLVASLFSLLWIRRTFKRWERAISRVIGSLLIVGGLKIALQRA